jgi:hypothetical protein
MKPDLAWREIRSFSHQEKAAAARSTGLRPIHFSNRAETAPRFSASLQWQSLQNCNHWQAEFLMKSERKKRTGTAAERVAVVALFC